MSCRRPTATGAPSPGALTRGRSGDVALFLAARGAQGRRTRVRLRAQPRRVDERGARDPGGGRRDGARLRVEHGGAGGLRRGALGRARRLRRHGAAAGARRSRRGTRTAPSSAIVLLDDALDVGTSPPSCANGASACPPFAEVERKIVPWSRARAIGRGRDQEDAGAFERTMDGVSLDQPGMMLYTSGTTGNPKGVPLTHRNVARQRPRLAAVQRAAARARATSTCSGCR